MFSYPLSLTRKIKTVASVTKNLDIVPKPYILSLFWLNLNILGNKKFTPFPTVIYTRCCVVRDDGSELGVSVVDVRRTNEADRQPALGHGRGHGHPVGPTFPPDLIVHPVRHVLKHHPDSGNFRILPVVDLEGDPLLHEARVGSGQSGDHVTKDRIRICVFGFGNCFERSWEVGLGRSVTDGLGEKVDPGFGAPIPVILKSVLK